MTLKQQCPNCHRGTDSDGDGFCAYCRNERPEVSPGSRPSPSEILDYFNRDKLSDGWSMNPLPGGAGGLYVNPQTGTCAACGAPWPKGDPLLAEWVMAHSNRRCVEAAERSAAEAEAEAIGRSRRTKHWDGCWRTRGHHNCAVERAERLAEELDELRSRPIPAPCHPSWLPAPLTNARLDEMAKSRSWAGDLSADLARELAEWRRR